MRGETMMKIVKAIVDIQRAFFISGEKADIRPMILKDISERTGLDLSVISRATADKYILTSHGVYPLKLFFNERPDAESDVSTHEILKAIQNIIAVEDKHSPMSDQAYSRQPCSKRLRYCSSYCGKVSRAPRTSRGEIETQFVISVFSKYNGRNQT